MRAQVKQREATFLHMEEAEAVRNSCADFLRQMGYREYSRYLSFHFPFTHERPLLQHLRACPWRLDQGAFKVPLPRAPPPTCPPPCWVADQPPLDVPLVRPPPPPPPLFDAPCTSCTARRVRWCLKSCVLCCLA